MAFGVNLFMPDQVKILNASMLGVNPWCCDVCELGGELMYCPRLLCKWRDKTYEDLKEIYKKE